MTRAELIANLLDMAESYKAMRSPVDTGEELHYLDYDVCIQTAAMLAEDSKNPPPAGRARKVKNMPCIIVCLDSSTAAAQFRQSAQSIPGRLTTAPRALQVSCALAWVSPVEYEADVLALAETIPHGVIARYDWSGML